MKFDNPILFFICSIGVFNGFIASFYFLFFSKQKRIQNSFFGLLLLMLSLRIGKSVYIIFTDIANRDLLIAQIGLSACFLIGISLFYYLKSSIENKKVTPQIWKIHYGILVAIIFLVGTLKPYRTHVDFWHQYFIHFIYTIWGIYLILSGYILKDVFKKLFTKNTKCTTSEVWLVAVFVGNILIFSAYMVGYFYLYLVGTITFSVVFYALLIFLLFKKNRDNIFQDIPEKYAAKKINEPEAEMLIQELSTLMHTKALFKNSDVKLKDLAEELKISKHHLSQLLNDNLGKSFAQYINALRIEEAKRLLLENSQFTLEAIGFEAGFSSKSTFYATFKRIIGQTPAEFKKQFS
ncbi:AraC family transcriptional regulator [Lacinutrix jangbogonensis]|uniref:AraC family transcriptional regulator n=1 Tax=Lacinutrix jangbogonensis TaxID=1469557 RepID=UPI00053F1D01|nr:helix-turn-helix domain-containing protein [Lacinutrix jangbogonensis]